MNPPLQLAASGTAIASRVEPLPPAPSPPSLLASPPTVGASSCVWSCTTCTLINTRVRTACTACGARRGSRAHLPTQGPLSHPQHPLPAASSSAAFAAAFSVDGTARSAVAPAGFAAPPAPAPVAGPIGPSAPMDSGSPSTTFAAGSAGASDSDSECGRPAAAAAAAAASAAVTAQIFAMDEQLALDQAEQRRLQRDTLVRRGFEEVPLTRPELHRIASAPPQKRNLIDAWCIVMECKDKAKRRSFDDNLILTNSPCGLAQSLLQLVTIYSCRCEAVGFQAKRRALDHITRVHPVGSSPSNPNGDPAPAPSVTQSVSQPARVEPLPNESASSSSCSSSSSSSSASTPSPPGASPMTTAQGAAAAAAPTTPAATSSAGPRCDSPSLSHDETELLSDKSRELLGLDVMDATYRVLAQFQCELRVVYRRLRQVTAENVALAARSQEQADELSACRRIDHLEGESQRVAALRVLRAQGSISSPEVAQPPRESASSSAPIAASSAAAAATFPSSGRMRGADDASLTCASPSSSSSSPSADDSGAPAAKRRALVTADPTDTVAPMDVDTGLLAPPQSGAIAGITPTATPATAPAPAPASTSSSSSAAASGAPMEDIASREEFSEAAETAPLAGSPPSPSSSGALESARVRALSNLRRPRETHPPAPATCCWVCSEPAHVQYRACLHGAYCTACDRALASHQLVFLDPRCGSCNAEAFPERRQLLPQAPILPSAADAHVAMGAELAAAMARFPNVVPIPLAVR
jgi:hypothetical protein